MATRNSSREQNARQAGREAYLTRDFLFICLSGLCFVLCHYMVNPALPLYLVQMGGTQGQVGMVLAIRPLAALITRPLGGMLVDKGFLGSLLAFAGLNSVVSAVSYVFVPAVWLVGAIEAFKGVGVTCYTTASSTAVADLAPPGRRGEAVGAYSVLTPVAMAFGPAIGVLVLARTSFATLFFSSAVLGVLSLVLAIQTRWPRTQRSTSTTLKLVNGDALLPAGALACTAFAMAPLWAFIPLYATQHEMGDLGPFYTVYAVVMILIRLVSGRLSDIHGRVVVFVPGAFAIALSNIYLSTDPGYLGLIAAGALLGGGLGVAQPALLTLAIDRARIEERGSAMSTAWAALDAGLTLGTLANGLILDWGGFAVMFGSNAAVALLGVTGFLLLDQRNRS